MAPKHMSHFKEHFVIVVDGESLHYIYMYSRKVLLNLKPFKSRSSDISD